MGMHDKYRMIRMMPRAVFIVSMSFAMAAWLACKKDLPFEREPNDSFANANPIMVDSIMRGVLSTRDDVDVYRIEISSPMVLNITLGPVRGVNHSFKIWRGIETPVLIKHVDDMRKSSPESLSNLFVEAGVYFISVGFGERDIPVAVSEGVYELEIRGRPYSNEEKEPNDNPANATEVFPDSELRGFFSPAYNRLNQQGESPLREEDWYRIDIDLPMKKPVLLDIELSGVERVNSIIELYNPALEKMEFSDAGGTHEGESMREIGITTPGTYYIMVASKNYESNHEREYRLKVNSRNFDAGMEMEPNDDNSRANTIIVGEISGRIFPPGDRDVFMHPNRGLGLYRMELTPPQTLDLIMEIFNSDGIKLFEADNGGPGFREVLPAVQLKNDFYITVRSRKSSSDPDRAYSLQVRQLTALEDYEVEPNDEKGLATPLKRQSIKGFTSKHKDRDFYLLDYGKRVKILFTLVCPPEAELGISITDPLGYIIRTRDLKGPGSVKFIEMIDQKGFVIIDALKENYDEPYILHVTEAK